MPEHTDAPSKRTAPMRLAKILNSFIPGMYDTPCRIAIFTDGYKSKYLKRSISASLLSIPHSRRPGNETTGWSGIRLRRRWKTICKKWIVKGE